MYSFSFEDIVNISEIDFSKSVIWVFHADKVPPHIGFSTENTFFSLKVSGKDEQLQVQNVLKLINKRKIPSLFIQISPEISLNSLTNAYEPHDRSVFGVSTCLTPIKHLVNQPDAPQLSDLLIRLDEKITKVAGIHLPQNYRALPSYSIDEIYSYISKLSKTHS